MQSTRTTSASQRGFSLIEMMIVLLLLTIIMGAAFQQINLVQIRYHTEEMKVDIVQSAREFVDQMTRDLHQAGFPNSKMYAPGTLTATPITYDPMNAVGLVYIDDTSVWFEGDVDGDGYVDSMRYTLLDSAGGSTPADLSQCPCTLQRSQVQKANGDPLTQGTAYNTELENVLGTSGPLFRAYDKDGGAVTSPWPMDYSANPTDIQRIYTINIMVTVGSRFSDIQTRLNPFVTLTATAQMNN